MKLTDKEQEICDRFSVHDKDGYVHCDECPLTLPVLGAKLGLDLLCYATIDGRLKEAKELDRL